MQTKNKILSTIIFLIFANTIFAQTNSEKYITAVDLQNNYSYRASLNAFFEINKDDPNNANLNYQIGYIYVKLDQLDSAIIFLERATDSVSVLYKDNYETKSAPTDVWFLLAQSYQISYMFEKAIDAYDVLKHYTSNKKEIETIDRRIQECNTALEFLMKPINVTIMPLNKVINSNYKEHSPVMSADLQTLIFTSKRNGTGGNTDEDGNYYEDIYISKRVNGVWASPKSISTNINTEKHEASVGLSADGHILYVYKDTYNGDIYESKLVGGEWTKPERLSINSIYRETHASISQDGSKLYFSSNRPGGEGGMDIYCSEKKSNGEWGRAINVGNSINTPFDEDSPYINSDDSTMFFSSNGHFGMGGYDLFFAQLQPDNSWSMPVNMGFPVNTTGDNIYYVASPGGGYAFYVSNKYGSYEDTDIYFMMLPDSQRERVGVFTGKVQVSETFDTYDDSTSVSIFVIDPNTKDTVKTYNTDPANGEYTLILPVEENYIIIYEADGCVTHGENVFVEKESDLQISKRIIPVQKVVLGETNENYTISFTPQTNSLTYEAQVFLDETIKTLDNYDDLIVELGVPLADSLKKEKTNSILEYFISENADVSKITYKNTDNEYFEILIADTLFLDYHSRDWNITFKSETPDLFTTSELTLDQMKYFLVRNPELFVEIPFSPDNSSELEYERVKSVYEYFVNNGIDSTRIVARNNNNVLPSNTKQLSILNDTIGVIPLFQMLNSFETRHYNQHLINIPIFMKNRSFFSITLAYDIKSYLAQRNLDTTRVNFIAYNFIDVDNNMTRLKILKEAQTEYENNLISENFIFVPFFNTSNFIQYKEKTPADIEFPAMVYDYKNQVRNNINIDRTYKTQIIEPEYEVLEKDNCGFLFANIGMSFLNLAFDYNKDNFQDVAVLDTVSDCLIMYPDVNIELAGHTDSKGTNTYNIDLANRRSNFVLQYFKNKGVNQNQLKSRSYGELQPIAPNNINGRDFPTGRKLNRRVELKVLEDND